MENAERNDKNELIAAPDGCLKHCGILEEVELIPHYPGKTPHTRCGVEDTERDECSNMSLAALF